jgi:hypothetical protein
VLDCHAPSPGAAPNPTVECRADADLTLLSKRAPPPGAWQGKVVWVVGASQVRGLAGWPDGWALGACAAPKSAC